MIGRQTLKIIYGQDPTAWAEKYGLIPFVKQCGCGREMTTTLPCFDSELRGLISPPCACGNTDTPYCLVRDPRFGDLLEVPHGR